MHTNVPMNQWNGGGGLGGGGGGIMTLEIAYDPCYNDHVLSSKFVTFILLLKN